MIKKLYKKIRLYFINRKIKKTQQEIDKLYAQLKWIKQHIHDLEISESYTYIKVIKMQLEDYKIWLNIYEQDKERLTK